MMDDYIRCTMDEENYLAFTLSRYDKLILTSFQWSDNKATVAGYFIGGCADKENFENWLRGFTFPIEWEWDWQFGKAGKQ